MKTKERALEKEQAVPILSFSFSTVFSSWGNVSFIQPYLSADQLHNVIRRTTLQVSLQTLQWPKDMRLTLILQIFQIQTLRFVFPCPWVSSKSLFVLRNLREKKIILNPDINSHNPPATTNTVAPLLTFYKNFILKIQALSF